MKYILCIFGSALIGLGTQLAINNITPLYLRFFGFGILLFGLYDYYKGVTQ